MESCSDSSDSEKKVFGRCRCCFQYSYVKEMWKEHSWQGIREIYGEMIMDTFSIALDTTNSELICESCVDRLRDAQHFKREVLSADKYIEDEIEDYEADRRISTEVVKSKALLVEYLQDWATENTDDEDDLIDEPEYFDVEYLEDEYTKPGEDLEVSDHNYQIMVSIEDDDHIAKRRSRKRPRKNALARTHKNYTEQDMRMCLESVGNNEMSITEASQYYNIPRKTVSAKVLQQRANKEPETFEEIEKASYLEKQYQFKEEIKTVLTYTNAMPFKVKGSKYYCVYCSKTKEYFEDPDALRIHAMKHENDRIKKIDYILRPYFMNEVLRVDINNFCCLECNEQIPTWNDMFIHLKVEHEVELDQTYTRLIPYNLDASIMHCSLCNTKVPNFCFLDAHMNAHYTNYMCSECGETFLSEVRLKHHLQIHNKGRYPCNECGKVFTLDKYKKKHVALVHERVKCFKCLYCAERFISDVERHLHVVESHSDKVQVTTCELCGKTFDWKPYYLAHLRKVHFKERKNKCKHCNKKFATKHEVKMHELRHTRQGKHGCRNCGKKFVTVSELNKHVKKHDQEWEEARKC